MGELIRHPAAPLSIAYGRCLVRSVQPRGPQGRDCEGRWVSYRLCQNLQEDFVREIHELATWAL